jgi:phospholipid/cholesterol/gamma-HCH transport system substrate-binding protein
VIELPLEDALAQGRCGVEGDGLGGRRDDGSGGATSTSTSSTGTGSLLDGMEGVEGRVLEQAPDTSQSEGLVGSPSLSEVTQ